MSNPKIYNITNMITVPVKWSSPIIRNYMAGVSIRDPGGDVPSAIMNFKFPVAKKKAVYSWGKILTPRTDMMSLVKVNRQIRGRTTALIVSVKYAARAFYVIWSHFSVKRIIKIRIPKK